MAPDGQIEGGQPAGRAICRRRAVAPRIQAAREPVFAGAVRGLCEGLPRQRRQALRQAAGPPDAGLQLSERCDAIWFQIYACVFAGAQCTNSHFCLGCVIPTFISSEAERVNNSLYNPAPFPLRGSDFPQALLTSRRPVFPPTGRRLFGDKFAKAWAVALASWLEGGSRAAAAIRRFADAAMPA